MSAYTEGTPEFRKHYDRLESIYDETMTEYLDSERKFVSREATEDGRVRDTYRRGDHIETHIYMRSYGLLKTREREIPIAVQAQAILDEMKRNA